MDQPNPLQIEMELSSFSDEKQYKAFVRCVKSIVRRSVEYKEWVNYIKYTMGYDYCSFTKEKVYEVTLDLHHHPISLENIVKIVIENKLSKFQPITTFDIAKEVMQLHYDGNVGYVLLVTTLHEKFHNGFLRIPIEFVHGNYKYILDNYYVPDDIKEVISKYEAVKLDDLIEEYGQQGYKWSRDNYVLIEE